MKQFWVVLGHTFSSEIKQKSFIISTIIIVALSGVLMLIPKFFDGDDFTTKEPGVEESVVDKAQDLEEIYVINDSGYFEDELELWGQSEGAIYDFKIYEGTKDELLEDIEEGNLAKGLHITTDEVGYPSGEYIVQQDDMRSNPETIYNLLNHKRTEIILDELGLSEGEIFLAQSDMAFSLTQTGKDFGEAFIVAYAVVFIMYFSLIMNANKVVMGVAYEKTNRVMETLITSVKPEALLFGKVIAIGGLGLLQLAIIGGSTFGFYKVLHPDGINMFGLTINIFEFEPVTILVVFMLFILGYFLYAMIYAAAGSIVSKIEDINYVVTPVTFLIVGAFIISIYALNDPNGTIAVATSMVPFFAPIIMVARVLMGSATAIQIIVSIALLVGTIIIVGWIAARIYKVGVLLYGNRPKLKDLIYLVKNK